MAKRKKPKQKFSAKKLSEIFASGFENESGFEILQEGNPFLFKYKEKKYYAFLRNLCHGGGEYPANTTRIEFPEKDEFIEVKESKVPVLVMGFDAKQDVFVCWEPKKSKARLNEKPYVSFFARKHVQDLVSNGIILASFLENKDSFIVVKRTDLPLFMKFLDFFPSGPVPFAWNSEDVEEEDDDTEDVFTPQDNYVKTYEQTIFYGVPGSGKSNKITEKLGELKIPKERTTRVVFHPDYSSSDFIGQILPKTKQKKVIYEFQPGPFAEILCEAYHDPANSYVLIIDEINRGNAAAIFGDVFQLLDRKNEKSKPEGVYKEGWSDYFINNENLRKLLKLPKKEGVRLPPNFSIWATMNTSDQNVFSLDNAFQRRWNMELISNNNLKPNNNQYKAKIEKLDCMWGVFRDVINSMIVESSAESGLSSLEDKRLGAWFVQGDKNNIISKKVFSNKVLKYLWDDAFKMDRPLLFKNALKKSLDDIIEEFDSKGESIFQDSFVEKIRK